MDSVTLILNIILAVFVGVGIIFGLIRGVGRTISRGVCLVITAIILLFVTIPITKSLLDISIEVSMTVHEEQMVGSYTIRECITFFIKNIIDKDFVAQNPELIELIISMPLALISAFVYVVLFILCKYLLLPIESLIYSRCFARKRQDNLGFSAFDGDNFDNENKQTLNEDQNYISSDNIQQLTTQPLHDIKDASEQNDNYGGDVSDSHHVLFDEQNSGENSLYSNANIDVHIDNNVANDQVNVSGEEQFGKEGLFIRREIEVPKVESVVAPNFDEPSKKDLKREKKEEKKLRKYKSKKSRLLGGLVGALVGMFIMSNIAVPLYGIVSIAKDVSSVKIINLSENEISLASATNGQSEQWLQAYDNSIFAIASKYSGAQLMSTAEFDILTTATVYDRKIKLRGDISSLAEVVLRADEIVGRYKDYVPEGDMSNLTQEQLTTLLEDCGNLLQYSKKVNLADCVGDYIIPVICTIVTDNGTKFSDNEVVNELIVNALKTLAKKNNINVFDEACNIVDLAKYLNDQKILIKVLKNDFDDPIAMVQNLDDDFGAVFTNKLFGLKSVKVTMPYVLNIALSVLEQSINYGYSEVDYSGILDTIEGTISSFIGETVNVAKSLDTTSDIYFTTESLKPLGKLLKTIKTSGIISNDIYYNLIDYATSQMQNVLKGLLPEELEDYLINELLLNISKVNNWEDEMGKIYSAVIELRDKDNGILGSVVEGKDLREGTNISITMKEEVFANIGKALDILDSTVLFGATSQKVVGDTSYTVSGTVSLFTSLLDYVESTILKDISDTSLQKITNVIADMKNNLLASEHVYSQNSVFWKFECENISTLAINAYNMIDSGDLDVTEEFGKALDKAKQTIMFGNDTSLKFMSVAFDIVQDGILGKNYDFNDGTNSAKPQKLEDKIYELFDEVKNNLELTSIKTECQDNANFWENEFTYYKKLKNIAEKSTSFSTMDDATNIAKDLDDVKNGQTIPNEKIFSIVSFAIKDLKVKDATGDLDIAINNVIDNIATTLDNPSNFDGKDMTDFWQIEFDHLANIKNIKFGNDDTYQVKDNLVDIGKELDKVVLGYSVLDIEETVDIDDSKTVRPSYLITANDLRNVLAGGMTQVSQDISNSFDNDIKDYITTALNSIKANILDTTNITNVSFERELGHMQTLANLEVSSSLLKYPTGSAEEISTKLNENYEGLQTLGENLDSIAFAKTYVDGVYKYTDQINANTSNNSKFVTRSIINTLISNVFNVAKFAGDFPEDISEQTDEQKEQIAFNNLIVDIQDNIQIASNLDLVMSWQRELGFVNNLVNLNNGEEYTIANVASKVGSNLDAIAFNTKEITSTGNFEFVDITYNASNECTFIPVDNEGNSLFIKRQAISTLLATYLNNVKVTTSADADQITIDKNNLINSIIDNTTASVAITNEQLEDDYYKNYNSCFSEVSNIKGEIENKINNISNSASLTLDGAQEIDSLLYSYQLKPVMGVLLTRRLAILILDKLGAPSDTATGVEQLDEAINYYNDLKTYYVERNNANNTQAEGYIPTTAESSNSYPNPFKNLYTKINITTP